MWKHRRGPAEPPLRLGQVTYDEHGRMQYPRHRDRAPETELRRYLEEATAILRAAAPATVEHGEVLVSEDFEGLRWFDLPPVCLSTPPTDANPDVNA